MPPTISATPDIDALRSSYQRARGEIVAFDDEVEREVGLATLRLEASHMLGQLRSTVAGLGEPELNPLTTYVASLEGGETAEATVRSIDETADAALKDVVKSLGEVTTIGSSSFVIGLILWIFNFWSDLGAAAATTVLAVGSVALFASVRFGGVAIPAAAEAMKESWTWASTVGDPTDHAMAQPRQIQMRLWLLCAGSGAWPYEPFSAKARSRAQLVVAVCWASLLFAASAFAVGVIEVFDAKFQP